MIRLLSMNCLEEYLNKNVFWVVDVCFMYVYYFFVLVRTESD